MAQCHLSNLRNTLCCVGNICSHVDRLHVACRFKEMATSPCRVKGSRAIKWLVQSVTGRGTLWAIIADSRSPWFVTCEARCKPQRVMSSFFIILRYSLFVPAPPWSCLVLTPSSCLSFTSSFMGFFVYFFFPFRWWRSCSAARFKEGQFVPRN